MPSFFQPRLALLVAASVLALSGCGRRGDLEPPPDGSAVQATKPADPAEGGLQVRKSNPPISPPHTPFLLDPLL